MSSTHERPYSGELSTPALLEERQQAVPKLSAASKMPCKSWSLPAWETCPGARNDDGTPVDACSMCYALQGRYLFGAVKAVRDHNLEDWKLAGWARAMVKNIGKGKFFRWFDSGDCYDPVLAGKIWAVMVETPDCKHWLPSRAFKDDSIRFHLERMNNLPNVVVRYSSDSITGERVEGDYTSTIIDSPEDFVSEKGYSLCRAYARKGKCGSCRACWSKKIHTIAYPIHGRKVKEKVFS